MAKLSDYVIRFVAEGGVKHVFLVPGGGAMHLNESLSRCSEIEPVCNSHEQASAIAAEAYAKATNNIGVALVTTGPGGTNAVTGVAGAWLDSTPCLFISGQVKRSDRMFDAAGRPLGMRQLGVQEVDIVSIVRPITKYAVTVVDPLSIRYHLEKAVHLARSGRPGPVWIDIPLDVQAYPLGDVDELPGFEPSAALHTRNCTALASEIDAVVEAFNRCERPLVFAGNGIRLAHAESEFRELVAALASPVAATWCAADLVSSEDPLFVGRPGTLASRGANFALQNCDFLLSIGARLDFAITGYAPEKLARGAHKVVVDVDPSELRKLAPHVQAPIVADAGAFVRGLVARRSEFAAKERRTWNERCAEWKTRYPVVTDEHRRPGGVSVYHLAEVLGRETEPHDLMVSGSSGSGIEVFLFACPTRTGQRIYHTAGLGAMGFGLPASIGVCLAGGRQRTICVDGDGGFQFNIQELETVRRLQLPIKFFVLNNDGYASIRASQTSFFGAARIGCDARTGLTTPDISRVAAAYGLQTAVIEDQDDLAGAVRRVLETTGPVVCDVRCLPDEARAPRMTSVQLPDGSFVSKPLEDLFPFLDRDELRSNMIANAVSA
ncbi:MAG: thiamine pyrophosphate-binding protein [Candidatus Baltobacteraceae bacterium]